MKKFAVVTLAALVALQGSAFAQSFDLSAMPLGQFPTATDDVSTGSIGARLFKRLVKHDGTSYTQFYTVGGDGRETIVSEKKN